MMFFFFLRLCRWWVEAQCFSRATASRSSRVPSGVFSRRIYHRFPRTCSGTLKIYESESKLVILYIFQSSIYKIVINIDSLTTQDWRKPENSSIVAGTKSRFDPVSEELKTGSIQFRESLPSFFPTVRTQLAFLLLVLRKPQWRHKALSLFFLLSLFLSLFGGLFRLSL